MLIYSQLSLRYLTTRSVLFRFWLWLSFRVEADFIDAHHSLKIVYLRKWNGTSCCRLNCIHTRGQHITKTLTAFLLNDPTLRILAGWYAWFSTKIVSLLTPWRIIWWRLLERLLSASTETEHGKARCWRVYVCASGLVSWDFQERRVISSVISIF